MVQIYLLKIFVSWYSIGLNPFAPSENDEYYPGGAKVANLFDYRRGYTSAPDVNLWISRKTGEIRESNVPLTREDALYEIGIDAFLGIVEVLNTHHLVVVTNSYLVAELDLGNVTFGCRRKSKIMMISDVKFFPINYQVRDPSNTTRRDSATLLNTTNFINLHGSNASINDASNVTNGPILDELFVFLMNIRKVLIKGHYYSYDTDLTTTLQSLYLNVNLPHGCSQNGKNGSLFFEKRLETNRILYNIATQDFNWSNTLSHKIPKRWRTVMIQGYVGYGVNEVNQDKIETLVIARRNVNRSGTRFVIRGIDNGGNVGNFVESELRVRVNRGRWHSYTLIRGSVPVFWEQAGSRKPITIYNSHNNFGPFLSHIRKLNEFYKPSTYHLFVSLLDISDREHERQLFESFMHLVNDYNMGLQAGKVRGPKIRLINYNYNRVARWASHSVVVRYILENLIHDFNYIGFFNEERYLQRLKHSNGTDRPNFDDPNRNYAKMGLQQGILRSNCLDCIDRSNMFEWVSCWIVLNMILIRHKTNASKLNYDALIQRLQISEEQGSEENGLFRIFSYLWAEHGDYISLQSTGTPCIMTPRVNRPDHSFNTIWHYGKIIAKRHYNSRFHDLPRQAAFDMITQYCTDGPYAIQPSKTVHKLDSHALKAHYIDSRYDPAFIDSRYDPAFIDSRYHTQPQQQHTHKAADLSQHTPRSPGKTLIALDITKTHNLVGYDIEYYANNTIFRAKKQFLFKLVKKGNKSLWAPKHDDYPDTVMLKPSPDGTYAIVVYLPPLEHKKPKNKFYQRGSDTEYESHGPDTANVETVHFHPELITLNVKHMMSTNEVHYQYDPETKTHTFTPRFLYMFNGVIKDDRVIWETQTKPYSDKVLVFNQKNGKRRLRVCFGRDNSGSSDSECENVNAHAPSDSNIPESEIEVIDYVKHENKQNHRANNSGTRLKSNL